MTTVLYQELEDMLQTIKVRSDRAPLGNGGYSQLLGFNRRKSFVPTVMMEKYPELYDKLQEISRQVCPFHVENFMVNKNFTTKPHYDKLNQGECFIFSVGDYEGGQLVIDGVKHDTRYNPIIFDGREKLHYNLPITRGTKWSFVGFNNRAPKARTKI